MLTKYFLNIGTERYELREDDLKNWDEIKCVYKRSGYQGVVRSFTSKFEFVNNAYRLLMDEFDRNGFTSKAVLELYLVNNNWNYKLEYSCQLDFSSLTYTEYVLSINAIDCSVESVIKANKSTKYEFILGDEMPLKGKKFLFDRLKIIETATYAITDGESQEDGSLIGTYSTGNNYRIYAGLTDSEVAIGKVLHLNDDQTENDGYLFSAMKNAMITLDYSINVGIEYGTAPLRLMNNDVLVEELHQLTAPRAPFMQDDQPSIEAVKNYIANDSELQNRWNSGDWGDSWVSVQGVVWIVEVDLGKCSWVNTGIARSEYTSDVKTGTVTFAVNPGDRIWLKFHSTADRKFKINSSSLKFSWTARGSSVAIDCVSPFDVLERLLWKMGVEYDAAISNYDSRLANTLILPAESIRDFKEAKLYISFNDFCQWMETVFGYTYVINEDLAMIEFKHREQIFPYAAKIIEIDGADDFEYTAENSVLYSSVVVGYGKRDYESVNGRDEFNFNSTYTTGYNNDGKKLELKSPLRADSYGIEFLVEKRNQETTDNESDKDTFFVLGVERGEHYYPKRSCKLENSLTGTLINGEFSPVSCVLANSEYISIMSKDMNLQFASTEGNADIVIDGTAISDDLNLENMNMLTAGEIKFICADQHMPADLNCRIRVRSNKFIYEGYIRQVSFTLARPEAVEYTLMIKSKTSC